MVRKSRRTFLRDAGIGGTVLAGLGVTAGSAAAESLSVDGLAVPAVTGDWQTFHGTAARSGYTATSGPVAEPASHRVRQSSPSVDSNLAVVDGVAYFVQDGRDPVLVAFDLASETTVWQTAVRPGDDAGVTVDDGTVYVVGGSQQAPNCQLVPPTLSAVDANDGTVQWNHEFDPVDVTWPTVVDGETYVVADDELVAVDSEGSESWRTRLADGTAAGRSATPAVADGTVVVADEAGLVALDVEDGSELWRHELADAENPSIADGTVYAADRFALVALDLADGTEQWRAEGSPTSGPFRPSSAPVVGNGRVAVAMDEEYVEAFSAADGAPEWRSDRLGDVSIGAGGETVYAAVTERAARQLGVFALDAADGETRWEYEPESEFSVEAPAIADGTLLFGGDGLTVLTEG